MSLLPPSGPEVPFCPWGYRGTIVWPPVPVLLPPLPPAPVPWPPLYLCLGCPIPNYPIISFGDAFLWLLGANIAAAQDTILSYVLLLNRLHHILHRTSLSFNQDALLSASWQYCRVAFRVPCCPHAQEAPCTCSTPQNLYFCAEKRTISCTTGRTHDSAPYGVDLWATPPFLGQW